MATKRTTPPSTRSTKPASAYSEREYAVAARKTALGAGQRDVIVREYPDRTEFLQLDARGRSVHFATLEAGETDLTVTFKAPAGRAEELAGQPNASIVADKPGWIRVHGPISKDPHAWDEIDAPTSDTCFEIATAGKWRSINSAGGPYVCLPVSKLPEWLGTEGNHYAKAQGGSDAGRMIEFPWGPVLVLGTPDTLYWWPTATGGLLIRVVSFDADDEDILRTHVTYPPDEGWEPIAPEMRVTEPLWVFDAALSGASVGRINSLQLPLAAATYRVESRSWQPDDETELILVRFSKL